MFFHFVILRIKYSWIRVNMMQVYDTFNVAKLIDKNFLEFFYCKWLLGPFFSFVLHYRRKEVIRITVVVVEDIVVIMAGTLQPFENAIPKNALEQKGYGCYPAGYNRKVHGPYDPARYYGPKDTAFGDVKMSELTQWIGRRDKSLQSMAQCISRNHTRWVDKFSAPRKATSSWVWQSIFVFCTFSYLTLYPKSLKHHKNKKYHWWSQDTENHVLEGQ